MSDIFVSYTRDDSDTAQLIAQALEHQGWSVWWDRVIPAGRVFDEVIEEAIDSAKCVVVLWSKKSIGSAWVKTEATEGADRGALVPVLIEDVRIPLAFRRIQAADLRGWHGESAHIGLKKLIADISAIIGPPPAAPAAMHAVSKTVKSRPNATTDTRENHDTERKPSPVDGHSTYEGKQTKDSPIEQAEVTGGGQDRPTRASRNNTAKLDAAPAPRPRRTRIIWYGLVLAVVAVVGSIVVISPITKSPYAPPARVSKQGTYKWEFKAPESVDNGAVVPVTLTGELRSNNSARIVSANGCWYSEVFNVSRTVVGQYGVRVKMGKTDELIGVVDADGSALEKARKRVTVKMGADTPCSRFSKDYTVSAADRSALQRIAARANQEKTNVKLRVAVKESELTLKALIQHPMEPHTFIRAVGVYLNGNSLAYVAWSPLISKDPYLTLRFQNTGRPGDTVSLAWIDNNGSNGVSKAVQVRSK